MDRSAVDTIRGYCYQFDKAILEVISLNELDDYIEVEAIEDIDVYQDGHLTAIQCKYYEGTAYNHSVIAKPLRLMLSHYKSNPNYNGSYHLFGHFKEGQNKLTLPLTIEYFKKHFLTYTEKSINHEYHIELDITDSEIQIFLSKLFIDINAKSFLVQKEEILLKIASYFNCESYEAEHYHYSNAFKVISDLSCNKKDRKITKKKFIDLINKSEILFNIWIVKYIGRKEYLKKIKSSFFSRTINTPPYARFFILDIHNHEEISDIKDCIYRIQNNWSNLSARNDKPFSPFIYLNNIDKNKLTIIKNELFDEGLTFCDGYPFLGSQFQAELIINNLSNKKIKFQLINHHNDLIEILENKIKNKVELYHFYIEDLIVLPEKYKKINIQIKRSSDILEII